MSIIYFDNNATTLLDERVLDAMMPFLTLHFGNPSSLYRMGRLVRSSIETAREQVAELIGSQARQIIFTSGGTEANNLALKGFACRSIAVSAIEHPSIMETASLLKRQDKTVSEIVVDAGGQCSFKCINRLMVSGVELVSIMLANNETGVIQDIAGIAAMLIEEDVIFHTDAVQALGKIPIDFTRLGVQLMSISSHKIYGPKGCGALVVDGGLNLSAQLTGGGQEQGFRAGTENVAAIIGFGKAAELARHEMELRNKEISTLRGVLQKGLNTIPELTIFAQDQNCLANTLQFGIPGVNGEMLLMQLDQKGISVSSGSACASGAGTASYVLTAMGIETNLAKSAIRVSLGKNNTRAEVEKFIAVLKSLVMTPY